MDRLRIALIDRPIEPTERLIPIPEVHMDPRTPEQRHAPGVCLGLGALRKVHTA
jgi:hypothetical protein